MKRKSKITRTDEGFIICPKCKEPLTEFYKKDSNGSYWCHDALTYVKKCKANLFVSLGGKIRRIK